MIREATEKLIKGSSLGMDEASGVMTQIMEGEATPVQLGVFPNGAPDEGGDG